MKYKSDKESAITVAYVRWLLDYEPLTGIFRWRNRTSNRVTIGEIAGHIDSRGYVGISVMNKEYKAHRLAWFWKTGEWPEYEIDHLDGDKSNNRWDNLRDVPHSLNVSNLQKAKRDNLLSLLGVNQSGERRFTARIKAGDGMLNLGTFPTAEEAHAAYLGARVALGHPMPLAFRKAQDIEDKRQTQPLQASAT